MKDVIDLQFMIQVSAICFVQFTETGVGRCSGKTAVMKIYSEESIYDGIHF